MARTARWLLPRRFLPGIGIEPTRSDTALDPAGWQAHSPVPPLDLHQIDRSRWAFGFGPRRGHFDLSHVPAGPARYRQVQHQLDWRSRCGHETRELLALSFNPFSGTVRAFGHRSYLSGRRRRARLLPASLRPPLKLDVQFSRITFHEDAALRAAIEGIIPTKLTSPYSP